MLLGTDLLHPEDVLFFAEVASVMKRVANKYRLPLRSIGHLPDEKIGLDTDRWGECDAAGNIKLLLRAKVNGRWTEGRLSPEQVWKTAAHELAHLKHLDHGKEHEELTYDLQAAISNMTDDHREKVIQKVLKMKKVGEGEAAIGNAEAADAFARGINRLLLENELTPSDVSYAIAAKDDPVIEVRSEPNKYWVRKNSWSAKSLERMRRTEWEEMLAHYVAGAHLCRILVTKKANTVWFVGTRSHALVAEYAYGTLVAAAEHLADAEYQKYYAMCSRVGENYKVKGFRQSWLSAFVSRIGQRLREERDAAIRAYAPAEGECTALVRLNNALLKVEKYIDDKFGNSKKKGLEAARGVYSGNADGRAWGRAAADRMSIGKKALESAPVRGLLGEGEK